MLTLVCSAYVKGWLKEGVGTVMMGVVVVSVMTSQHHVKMASSVAGGGRIDWLGPRVSRRGRGKFRGSYPLSSRAAVASVRREGHRLLSPPPPPLFSIPDRHRLQQLSAGCQSPPGSARSRVLSSWVVQRGRDVPPLHGGLAESGVHHVAAYSVSLFFIIFN